MQLTFSHVDVLVLNLEEACAYYHAVLNAQISRTLVWERDGLHVRYAIARMGAERFMLVQPLAGNLKELLDTHGDGTIYRHCYSTPDIEVAYDELVARGVQPEDENGKPLARDQLGAPGGQPDPVAAPAVWKLLHRAAGASQPGTIHRRCLCGR